MRNELPDNSPTRQKLPEWFIDFATEIDTFVQRPGVRESFRAKLLEWRGTTDREVQLLQRKMNKSSRPELAHAPQLIPLPDHRDLTPLEKYAVLAAIRDVGSPGEKIDPWFCDWSAYTSRELKEALGPPTNSTLNDPLALYEALLAPCVLGRPTDAPSDETPKRRSKSELRWIRAAKRAIPYAALCAQVRANLRKRDLPFLRQYLNAAQRAAATLETGTEDGRKRANGTVSRGKRKRGLTVNDRMKELLQTTPESAGWTARRFASMLKCSPGTVGECAAWTELEMTRLAAKAEKRRDRHRKPKASDVKRWTDGD